MFKECGLYYNVPGPRNWHPRDLTADQRYEDKCPGLCKLNTTSVTIRSAIDLTSLNDITVNSVL
jgi:hypothetical protein